MNINSDDVRIKLRRATGLRRFIRAQDRKLNGHDGYTVYEQAMQELRNGHKYSHWVWFIFPQPQMPGRYSENTRIYSLTDAEAERYLRHPKLGPRLRWSIDIVIVQVRDGVSLVDLLGPLDARKFIRCVDLFTRIDPQQFTPIKQRLAVAAVVHQRINAHRVEERKD